MVWSESTSTSSKLLYYCTLVLYDSITRNEKYRLYRTTTHLIPIVAGASAIGLGKSFPCPSSRWSSLVFVGPNRAVLNRSHMWHSSLMAPSTHNKRKRTRQTGPLQQSPGDRPHTHKHNRRCVFASRVPPPPRHSVSSCTAATTFSSQSLESEIYTLVECYSQDFTHFSLSVLCSLCFLFFDMVSKTDMRALSFGGAGASDSIRFSANEYVHWSRMCSLKLDWMKYSEHTK